LRTNTVSLELIRAIAPKSPPIRSRIRARKFYPAPIARIPSLRPASLADRGFSGETNKIPACAGLYRLQSAVSKLSFSATAAPSAALAVRGSCSPTPAHPKSKRLSQYRLAPTVAAENKNYARQRCRRHQVQTIPVIGKTAATSRLRPRKSNQTLSGGAVRVPPFIDRRDREAPQT
jgi:hypothetical protein